MYQWERNKKIQPSLKFYRKFNDGSSKLFVLFLDACKVVTCCDDLIEITNFGISAKITKSHKLNSPATCMATKDGNIYVGSKSSEIVVFDSVLAGKKTITVGMKSREWPFDLTVIPGKLFMCTEGSSERALSWNVESGRQITEYTYEGSQAYEDCNPLSITVNESLDLVGISWCGKTYSDWSGETVSVTLTFHSLSSGVCVSVMDNYYAQIIRFSVEGCITTTESKEVEYHLLDQMISFESWKVGFADSISRSEYNMLREFYQVSLEELDDEVDEVDVDHYPEDVDYPERYYTASKKGLMKILTKKGCITTTNVTSLRDAFAGLGNFYRNKYYQPVEAYIKYASKTRVPSVSVASSTHSANVAESLLQLGFSTQCGGSTTTFVNTVSQPSDPIQCSHRQLSTGEDVTSSLPVPSSTPSIEALATSAGKRAVGDGDLSTAANGPHGKRAKTVERDSGRITFMDSTDCVMRENSTPSHNQLSTQTPEMPSFLQLMEGHQPPSYINLSLCRPFTAVRPTILPGHTQVEILPSPMVAGQSCQSSSLQDGSLGRQQIGQVVGAHNQVRLEMQSHSDIQVGGLTRAAQQGYIPAIQQGYSPSAQQGHMGVTSPQCQTRTHNLQSQTHQVPSQSGQTVPMDVTQHTPPPQFQPVEHLLSMQRGGFIEQNVATTLHQLSEIPVRQIASHKQRQNVGQQEVQRVAQSLTPRMASMGNISSRPLFDDSLRRITTPQTSHQTGAQRNMQPEQRRDFGAEQDIQQPVQLEQQNNSSLEGQAGGRSTEQQQLSSQPGTTFNTNETHRTECESAPTSSQGITEEMKTVVELCVQKCVTPLLRDINDKLKHLLGSSSSQYPQQDMPGTSSQSGSNVSCSVVHDRDSPDNEPDDELRTAWESLSEYNRMSLQAFRGMTDDRAEVVRRLVEMVLTDEERRNRNCFGKSGKQKLDDNKLRKIRHITFYLCPIISKNTDSDKLSLEDLEWKRLCEVIDKANRHYREKLKRQERRR